MSEMRPTIHVGCWYKDTGVQATVTLFPGLATLHPEKFADFVAEHPGADFGHTNNPYFVDCFDADRVLVHGPNGAVKPLSEHWKWPKWQGEMSTGEFWSLVGEAWVEGWR